MTRMLNEQERRRHKRRNQLQSLLLLGGMALLLAACGWLIAGPESLFWILLAAVVALLLAPQASPELVLRLYRAVPLHPAEVPALAELLAELTRRANLPRTPALFYVPSRMMNAFAVGSRRESAIAVTDGMLRRLSLREFAGVLAHEVSHIRNNDLWVMGLADLIGRLTGAMSFAGVILAVLGLPAIVMGASPSILALAALLLIAPTLAGLLQLALSRTREFDADIDAAGLTGDPRGLASALAKLEREQAGLWQALFLPGRRTPHPSLLRTHPDTRERIARLLALEQRPERILQPVAQVARAPVIVPVRLVGPRDPRWHANGVWY